MESGTISMMTTAERRGACVMFLILKRTACFMRCVLIFEKQQNIHTYCVCVCCVCVCVCVCVFPLFPPPYANKHTQNPHQRAGSCMESQERLRGLIEKVCCVPK